MPVFGRSRSLGSSSRHSLEESVDNELQREIANNDGPDETQDNTSIDTETSDLIKMLQDKIQFLEAKISSIPDQNVSMTSAYSTSAPRDILTARRLLRDVMVDFPALSSITLDKFVIDAQMFANTYFQNWPEQLKMDVTHSILQSNNPDKQKTLLSLRDASPDLPAFLRAVASHYCPLNNEILNEEIYNVEIGKKHALTNSGHYQLFLDHLRDLASNYLNHLSERERALRTLKSFIRQLQPPPVAEAAFLLYGRSKPRDLVSTGQIRELTDTIKGEAILKYIALQRHSAPIETHAVHAIRSVDQKSKVKHVPLAMRTPEERHEYFRLYNWALPLCPTRKSGQRCPVIQTCSKKYRHLMTNQERDDLLQGRPLTGAPSTFEEAMAAPTP